MKFLFASTCLVFSLFAYCQSVPSDEVLKDSQAKINIIKNYMSEAKTKLLKKANSELLNNCLKRPIYQNLINGNCKNFNLGISKELGDIKTYLIITNNFIKDTVLENIDLKSSAFKSLNSRAKKVSNEYSATLGTINSSNEKVKGLFWEKEKAIVYKNTIALIANKKLPKISEGLSNLIYEIELIKKKRVKTPQVAYGY